MEQQVPRSVPEDRQRRKQWERPAVSVLMFKETASGSGVTPDASPNFNAPTFRS